MSRPSISIIILTKNAQQSIGKIFSIISRQKIKNSPEIIILDNSSTDKTLEIIKKFPLIRLVKIKPKEFSHSRTRNLGASLARGDYIVFLNGDAIPKDKYWLASLVKNFETYPQAVGVYSRHLPKKDCHFYMAVEILGEMKPLKRVQDLKNASLKDKKVHILDFMRFSTVSCAIKKQIWQKYPFNEKLDTAEDLGWSKRVLEKGYSIIYEPVSIVFHSHNYTLRETFKNHVQYRRAFARILGRKESIFFILWRDFTSSILIGIKQILYARKHGYGIVRIVKESAITFVIRIAVILGDIWGSCLTGFKKDQH